MNTPAHLLLAAAVFAKPECPKITVSAITGALLPDVSLYVMAGFSLFILDNSPGYVFATQYFSTNWQQVFAIDNSFILWAILGGLALWLRKSWLIALTGGALLHLCFDFPLHHDDARMHFWPVSTWVFESPLSYWDSQHFGGIISLLEQLMVISILVLLWRRFKTVPIRVFYILLTVAELAPVIIFALMF